MRRSGLWLSIAILLGGCGGTESTSVTRDFFGAEKWPLTVDSADVACEVTDGGPAVTVAVDGTTYALNGTAKSFGKGVDLDPVWADDPGGAGAKVSVGPLIEFGRALCL